MKKTLITLMALAGVASAAIERGDNLWSIDFGTKYTGNYQVTSTQYSPSKIWDMEGCTLGENYVGTTGSKRMHVEWKNTGTGLTFGDDFGIELVFTLPENYRVSAGKVDGPFSLITLSTGNRNQLIHFGPDTTTSKVNFAGSVVEESTVSTDLILSTGVQYTAQLEFYSGAITLKINDSVIQSGTLTNSATGTISDIMIGGGWVAGDYSYNNWIEENVHSVTAYKIIPEPATATLSLLALAGLAARRRRK